MTEDGSLSDSVLYRLNSDDDSVFSGLSSDSEDDAKSLCTGLRSLNVCQDFTFGKERCRDIALENLRLAERLARVKKSPYGDASRDKKTSPRRIQASSAINRKKMQWDIDRNNALLARKLAETKSGLASQRR